MVVLDGNFALGCVFQMDYPLKHIFQCMLEQRDANMNKVLEPITFILSYPTVLTTLILMLIIYLKLKQESI